MHLPIFLVTSLLPSIVLSSPATRRNLPDATLPYQYFFMGKRSADAVCWLTPGPFHANDKANLDCKISTSISQLPDRQTWQCTGERSVFCSECVRVKEEMQPAERGKYRMQGCD